MRILFVTAAFLPQSIGGVELHVLGLARELRAEHSVAVFCRGSDPARGELELERTEYQGIPVARLNYLFSDCTGFPMIWRNAAIRARFEAFLDEYRPDVVHVHHLTCLSTDLIDAAKARGARVVMTLHDFWMGCPRGQRMTPDLELCSEVVAEKCAPCLTRMWSGWFGAGRDGPSVPEDERRRRDLAAIGDYHDWIRGVLGRVDRLVTPSRSSRAIFARFGVPADRIAVVENGLDHEPFRAVRRVAAPHFRFGFIGTVLPTKGVHVLIDAFARLARPAARLAIHGEECGWHEVTGYGELLREQARPLGDRVALHGRYAAEDLPAILGTLDCLVVPSLWFEAFCLTLREGWLAGLPVIASRLGAMAEAIDDGATGLLFAPGDAADLARQMARVMDDAALRSRLYRSEKRVRTAAENAAELAAIYRGERGLE